MGQPMTRGKGNICGREKEEKREEGRHTSNLSSLSNIGPVANVSFLCLDYKRKEKTKRRK